MLSNREEMINMQYIKFKELEENEIFDIKGGGYDAISSCINGVVAIIYKIFNK